MNKPVLPTKLWIVVALDSGHGYAYQTEISTSLATSESVAELYKSVLQAVHWPCVAIAGPVDLEDLLAAEARVMSPTSPEEVTRRVMEKISTPTRLKHWSTVTDLPK
jgi:hypothetical protein